ncbi:MAG: hypothetical protein ABIW50_03355 [Candidatus Limnocylindria bacterium]
MYPLSRAAYMPWCAGDVVDEFASPRLQIRREGQVIRVTVDSADPALAGGDSSWFELDLTVAEAQVLGASLGKAAAGQRRPRPLGNLKLINGRDMREADG